MVQSLRRRYTRPSRMRPQTMLVCLPEPAERMMRTLVRLASYKAEIRNVSTRRVPMARIQKKKKKTSDTVAWQCNSSSGGGESCQKRQRCGTSTCRITGGGDGVQRRPTSAVVVPQACLQYG
ncbi:hypothetical protein PI124_g18008 [Phytophthora idaei]|nr:hypothetical protein PI125_g20382 [Phytophthora idaei]KAG3236988.1 hypothetical protein PI124_g18008 [Phytophthora idaei]